MLPAGEHFGGDACVTGEAGDVGMPGERQQRGGVRAIFGGVRQCAVAERNPLTTHYLPGRRGPWLKVKNVRHQEVIVAGRTRGEGRRADTIGSLVLGVYDERSALCRPANTLSNYWLCVETFCDRTRAADGPAFGAPVPSARIRCAEPQRRRGWIGVSDAAQVKAPSPHQVR